MVSMAENVSHSRQSELMTPEELVVGGQTMSAMFLLHRIGPWDVYSLVWLTCQPSMSSHPAGSFRSAWRAHVGFSSVVLNA